MRIGVIAFQKLYWIAVACVPIFPLYILQTYNSRSACSDSGICFHFGYLLHTEGTVIVLFAAVFLWPLCVWRLGGKHIWPHIKATLRALFAGRPINADPSSATLPERLRATTGSNFRSVIRRAASVFVGLYWLVVVSIPLFQWYLFGMIVSPGECLDYRACIRFFVPLDGKCIFAVVLSVCLLWPMCIWQSMRRINGATISPPVSNGQ